MKKIAAIFMSSLLVFCLAACGNEKKTEETTPKTDTPKQGTEAALSVDSSMAETKEEEPSKGEKNTSDILIVYFSVPEDVDTSGTDAIAGASVVVKDGEKLGNMEYVAKLIQETVGGDLFRIETVEPYPLDHDPLVDQAAEEQDAGLRPELATHVENFEQYEYVFLGYPNWWGDMPQPLYTFLEEYDFASKTIIPFITHGGSGASCTLDTIAEMQPDAVILDDELVLSRGDVADSEDTVVNWAGNVIKK